MPKNTLKLRPSPKASTEERKVAKRWTAKLVADGFTPVSDYFLKNYHRLSPPLTSSEAMLVVHLVLHKWGEDAPYPAFKTLAKRMGITATSARNHARKLEQKSYLHREKRVGTTNRFHLEPLFEALEKLRAADERGKASAAKDIA